MPYTIVVHVHNDEPIVAECDELPGPSDTTITVKNPRRRDGKDIHYLQDGVISLIWPINQITLIEVMPGEGDQKIIGFVRE